MVVVIFVVLVIAAVVGVVLVVKINSVEFKVVGLFRLSLMTVSSKSSSPKAGL